MKHHCGDQGKRRAQWRHPRDITAQTSPASPCLMSLCTGLPLEVRLAVSRYESLNSLSRSNLLLAVTP